MKASTSGVDFEVDRDADFVKGWLEEELELFAEAPG
jgi:hypothetical protein